MINKTFRFEISEDISDLHELLCKVVHEDDREAQMVLEQDVMNITPVPNLATMDLFATPDDVDALQAYIHMMNSSERMVALTVMGMTWNLCAKITQGES